MRKLIFTFLLLCTTFLVKAQTQVFFEDFDNPPPNMTSSGSHTWDINSRIQTSLPNSDTSFISSPGDVTYLETPSFDCSFNFFVTLSFKSICKVEFFDGGTIEISIDGGNNWIWLRDDGTVSNCVYMGTANFAGQNSRFQEASYGNWAPGNATAVPDNSWWQTEVFDISQIAGNNPDVRLRFKLADNNNNGSGAGGQRTGWAVDDIEVIASFCELTAPNVYQTGPVYQGTIYNLGPFNVGVQATDDSGIGAVNLYYFINGVLQPVIPMTNTSDSSYFGSIPPVVAGDTICYYIEVSDGSFCANLSYWPGPDTTQTVCFDVQEGISLPYCDNFDITLNLWTSQTNGAAGSDWELGTPAFGATNSAFTNPNAWDINLTAAYSNSAESILLGPELSNVPVGSRFSFRHNRFTEQNWDGVRLEWAPDAVAGPWTIVGWWQQDPNCVTAECVNWYSNDLINSSGLPAWDGTSNGWVESSILLDGTMGTGIPSVFYRFVFTSDGSVTSDGMSIDNVCITPPLPDDVGVSAITQPGQTGPAGNCVDVIVTIKNYGLNPQSNFPVTYVGNGGTPQTVTFAGPIAPGATAQVTLPCLNIVAGINTICAYTELSTDANNFNDTLCTTSLGIPVLTLTSCDDFESGNAGWQDSTSNPGAAQWQLGTPAFGATTGAHSGTNAWDINLANGYGVNAYAAISSPIYDFAGAINPYLSFWRNQLTAANEGIRVMYETGGSGVWNVLGTVNDPNGYNWYNNVSLNFSGVPGWDGGSGGWKESRYYLQDLLTSTAAQYIRFRIEFISGFNAFPNDGVSIDDFCVKQPGPDDVGVIAIAEPFPNGPAGGSSNIQFTIRNFGSASQSNIPVGYTADNGNLTGTGTFPGTLAPGATGVVTITPPYTIPSGQYNFSAFTDLPGDSDLSNDTMTIFPVGVPVIVVDYTNPFDDNFDGVNVGWSTSVGGVATTIWELGPPAFGATNSAFSPPNAWDVNLNTGYGANANCTLLSPIFDLSNAADPQLSFWRNHTCEAGWDGTRLEYSKNGGPWTLLGTANAPAPCWTNWYNQVTIQSSGQPAWAGATGGWVNSKAECLSFLDSSLVQFRFIFTSDGSVQQDGFSIDNFQLTIPVPLTAAPLAINTNTINTSFIFPGQSVQFSSPISNPGTTSLTSVNATITISPVGQPPVVTYTDPITYNPSLPSQQNLLHTFSQLWTAVPGVYEVCVITSEPNNGIDQNPFDDTTCITISVFDSVTITSANPYCTDFESGPQWVSVNALTYNNPGNDWQLGTPAEVIINGARSGVNAWSIDLDEDYNNRDTSGLFTPVFSVDNTKCYEISFWHKFDTEPFADGGTVEYSVDNAMTWNQLGFASSQPQPWFNTAFITALGGSPGTPGWSGTESNWIEAKKEVTFGTTGTVIFRFRFASDNTINNYEGWAMDDFCFKEIPGPCTVGLNDPTSDDLMLGQNYPNPFNATSTIQYAIPTSGHVRVSITNLLGQEIATPVDNRQDAGMHSFTVNSKDFGSGIYYYSLEFEGQKITRKLIITE